MVVSIRLSTPPQPSAEIFPSQGSKIVAYYRDKNLIPQERSEERGNEKIQYLCRGFAAFL